MALSGISPIANTGQGLVALNPPAAVSPSSTRPVAAVASSAPVATANPAPLARASAPAPKPAAFRGGGGGSSSGAAQQLITDTYTTTVGGKSYTGSVQQQPGGGYIASIPNLPGATATGASLQAAENNLGAIIDALA